MVEKRFGGSHLLAASQWTVQRAIRHGVVVEILHSRLIALVA